MTQDNKFMKSATEEHTYELAAIYFSYDAPKGIVTGRDEVIGRFIRKPYPGSETADAFEWLDTRIGHADSREAPIETWRDLEYAKGFSYVFDFEAEMTRFPMDMSSVPHDPGGWFYYVHILDSHNQFDIQRTIRYGKSDQLLKPGSSVIREHSEHFDLVDWAPFLRADFDKSSKINITTWIGSGEYASRPANVLYYRCDDVPLSIEIYPANLKSQGMTNYHGHIYIDKETKVLLGGDLFEYLPMTAGYQHRKVYLRLID